MNLILMGFKRSGKTTYGRMLSKVLKLPFIDLDDWIIEAYQKKTAQKKEIHEIYQDLGETAFRALEQNTFLSLKVNHAVISTGGGTLLSPFNQHKAKELGLCVYLKRSENEVKKALQVGRLPSYLDLDHFEIGFQTMFEKRSTIFEQLADFTLDIEDKSNTEVLESLVQYCNQKSLFS